jgi:DNA-binding SARP family transcriptional activator
VLNDVEGGAVLDARFLGPTRSPRLLTQPSLQAVHDSPLTVISAGCAHIVEENLAKVLDDDGRFEHAAWLRLSRLDAQPGHLVESAARSVARLEQKLGGTIGTRLDVESSGAVDLATTGAEAADRLPTDATLVVDTTRGPAYAAGVIELIDGWLSPAGDRRAVLLGRERPRRRVRRRADAVLGPRSLGMSRVLAHRLAAESDLDLPARSIDSLVWLTRGRAAVLHPLLTEIGPDHPELVSELLLRCRRRASVPDYLVRSLLGRCGPTEREILSVALDLGFWHRSMTGGSLADEQALRGVWLSPLEQGWFRMPPAWAPSLHRQLHSTPPARPEESRARRRSARSTEVASVARAPSAAAYRAVEWSADGSEGLAVEVGPEVPVLEARLLGGFEASVDGRRVSFGNGPRGLMLLKYLLTHHPRPQQRDVLMDIFWPGVDPDRARSRLHVALSGLRRSFRGIVDAPVVEFRSGAYQISSAVEVRTDVEEFEQVAATAAEAQQAGDTEKSIELCEWAIATYRGDFLADEPYEEWTLLRRETLRIKYLDLLDRLTALYLDGDRIGECIGAAQQILHQDACREDAHRLLMRCYARQGRLHQVSRQFELCTRAMESGLGCGPSEATASLYRSIRLEHSR